MDLTHLKSDKTTLKQDKNLRLTPLNESWIEANIPNVTVATMRKSSILSLIQVPVIRLRTDSISFEALYQLFIVLSPHRTTHNFPHIGQQ
ncbi:hypothetical protein BpHYR1_013230 [Brachionus plicatilis]|uniref:Uncharacterized protein n=1 Tax=Brachionus plicatilis TaxID=10195 RepID=A0A3M7RRX9_BRAPC|nr:hypothetical protein BpHYR1_013230 [Brachionus plicatilis]